MLKDITQIDLKILGMYIPDYSASFSIRHITGILKINYSHTFKRVKNLVKMEILQETKIGAANSISLNINNLDTIRVMCFVEELKGSELKNSTLPLLVQEAIKIDPLCCIGLFGSRASGKATAGSDWDVFVITRQEKRREMEKLIKKFPHVAEIQLLAFGIDEFREGLFSPEETVVKHIVRNKQVLYNPHPFYSLISLWEKMKYAPTQRD